MRFLKQILCVITIGSFISCKSQNGMNTKAVDSIKTWYTYTMDGELQSCTFYKDKIVYKSPIHSESNKSTSTAFIEKILDSVHVIVRNDYKKSPYAVVKATTDKQSVLSMIFITKGVSVEAAEASFINDTIPAWIDLTKQNWYTKEKIDQLEKAPGLDELKREDLLTALQWRKPLGEKLQQYLEDTQGKNKYIIYRFVEQFRNRKLVELGYNPYKRVVYNFKKQFEGDEEILKLLFEDIKF
ncbi:hypothetical protein MHTCC0001_30500 [Flavobacteriaceae bacterium MHTCC 0001]